MARNLVEPITEKILLNAAIWTWLEDDTITQVTVAAIVQTFLNGLLQTAPQAINLLDFLEQLRVTSKAGTGNESPTTIALTPPAAQKKLLYFLGAVVGWLNARTRECLRQLADRKWKSIQCAVTPGYEIQPSGCCKDICRVSDRISSH